MSTPQHYWINWRQIVLDDSNLSFGAKGLAMFLNTYMNDHRDMAYPSISTICKRLSLSDRSVTKYTDELAEAGYLLKKRRYGKTTQYVATIPPQYRRIYDTGGRSSIVESTKLIPKDLRTNNQYNNQDILYEKENNSQKVTKEQNSQKAAKEILDFLNEKSGKKFRPGKANLRFITARLQEYSADDLKQVIIMKTKEWKGGALDYCLRPATLFNNTKCAQYVGELWKKENERPSHKKYQPPPPLSKEEGEAVLSELKALRKKQ